MQIDRIQNGWSVVVPAKVNLHLEVCGRRNDGYHELDTVMVAVDLCDRLEFRPRNDSKISLEMFPGALNKYSEGHIATGSHQQEPVKSDSFVQLSHDDRAWDIPLDNRNLIVKALEQVRSRLGVKHGIDVTLLKTIPAQAGLGGGSANAAAAIVGGQLLWNNEYNVRLTKELAGGLGSDINFFVEGGSNSSTGNDETADYQNSAWIARCSGRGELVFPIDSNWQIHLVLLHPAHGCSTQVIFNRLRETQPDYSDRRSSQAVIEAYQEKNLPELGRLLFNRLEEAAAIDTPWINRMKQRLTADSSVVGCGMSGSGSCMYALVENADQANQLATRMRSELPIRTFAVSTWFAKPIEWQLHSMNKGID